MRRVWSGNGLCPFQALFLIAWLADEDFLICCIVTNRRQIAKMFYTFNIGHGIRNRYLHRENVENISAIYLLIVTNATHQGISISQPCYVERCIKWIRKACQNLSGQYPMVYMDFKLHTKEIPWHIFDISWHTLSCNKLKVNNLWNLCVNKTNFCFSLNWVINSPLLLLCARKCSPPGIRPF